MAAHILFVHNVESQPFTFSGPKGESNIDITLATMSLSSRQEPMRMQIEPGPMLALYAALENGALKTAELKKAIDPAKLRVQA